MLRIIVLYVLIPPLCLLFLTLLGLFLQWRYRRLGYTVVWIGAVSLFVLALPAFANTLLVPLEQNLPLTPPPD